MKQKACLKGTRGTGDLLYIEQHISSESKTRRKNLAMVWMGIQKGLWHSFLTMFQNEQNIRRSHWINRENHGKLESRFDNRKKKLSWSENPERGLPWKCAIIITICYRDDDTQPRSKEVHRPIEISQIAGKKINYLMCMDDIKLFARNEKQLEILIRGNEIFYSDIGMDLTKKNAPC